MIIDIDGRKKLRIEGDEEVIMKNLAKIREEYMATRFKEATLLRNVVEEILNVCTDSSEVREINEGIPEYNTLFNNWIYFTGIFEKEKKNYYFIVSLQVIDQDLKTENIHILENRIGIMIRKSSKNFNYNLKDWLRAPTAYKLPLNNTDRLAIAKLIMSSLHTINEDIESSIKFIKSDEAKVSTKEEILEDDPDKFINIEKEYFTIRNDCFKKLNFEFNEEIKRDEVFQETTIDSIGFGFSKYKGRGNISKKSEIKYGLELQPYNLSTWRYFVGKVKINNIEWNFIVNINVIKTNSFNIYGDTDEVGIMVKKADKNHEVKYNIENWSNASTGYSLENMSGKQLKLLLKERIDSSDFSKNNTKPN
ncbi:hypothetical protein [Macrococcus equipercicus]|uniref:Uncharacterized protein n=1 Tax=Macrococcus equipercicus TaxID=69967 RepID=A0A9Q9F1B6_9STAP|nr:hypothetical protein [Macrococcus equipercicus]UTH13858.1 hypothetical protein KFV11_00325 [Macrococcus equipercicus]